MFLQGFCNTFTGRGILSVRRHTLEFNLNKEYFTLIQSRCVPSWLLAFGLLDSMVLLFKFLHYSDLSFKDKLLTAVSNKSNQKSTVTIIGNNHKNIHKQNNKNKTSV